MLEPIVVIPARYESARYRGKPLARIRGADGVPKTLIQRTWEAGMASGFRTIVATDHHAIADLAVGFGAEVFISKVPVRNGTERCALFAAHAQLPRSSVVINLQGDACLTPTKWLLEMAYVMTGGMGARSSEYRVATMVAPLLDAYPHGTPDSAVVAYTDTYGMAYYFGRDRHGRRHHYHDGNTFAHFGVYAYKVDALIEYMVAGPAPLEILEDLEQNRWAHLGVPVRAVWHPEDSILPVTEVNTPGDVAIVEGELAKWKIS